MLTNFLLTLLTRNGPAEIKKVIKQGADIVFIFAG